MKKQLSILLIMLIAISLPAQDKQHDHDQTRLQEHLMFQDGKMYQIRNETNSIANSIEASKRMPCKIQTEAINFKIKSDCD
ncbi:MAG: hypothetical protein U5K54_15865 [Cytophagales bacterium]|nr:hypothetical protein [Cytophagales bacterium]